jgi:hypothetical protein
MQDPPDLAGAAMRKSPLVAADGDFYVAVDTLRAP